MRRFNRFHREKQKRRNRGKVSETPAPAPIRPIESLSKQSLDFKIYLKDNQNSIGDNFKIAAYTSITVSHANADNQLMAVESWHKLGIDIYSLNNAEEIQALKDKYPSYVKFIPCIKSTKHIFGKSCVLINDMIDHFCKNQTGDIIMLVNSDIIFNTNTELIDKIKTLTKLCIPISHRDDYAEEFGDGQKYKHGFDVFFINKTYINMFPPSMYSMGQTWWDYWIPYIAIKNKAPVFLISDSFAFHKEHPIQYNIKHWIKMTEYFKWENNIAGSNSQEITDSIKNEIIKNSISFNLC